MLQNIFQTRLSKYLTPLAFILISLSIFLFIAPVQAKRALSLGAGIPLYRSSHPNTGMIGQDFPDPTADIKITGFDHPAAIALAPNGRVFVAIFGNDGSNAQPFRQGSVQSWASTAALASGAAPDIVLGQAGAIQVGNPEAIIVDAQNRLYLADTGNHRLMVYNSVTTTGQQPNYTFGVQGTSSLLENKFQFVRGMALDSQNHLFATDTYNNRVLVYNLPITSNNQKPIAQFTGLSGPRAVAVDSNNNVYIADSENGQVKIFLTPIAANNYTTPNDIIGEQHASNCTTTTTQTTATYLSCPIDLLLDNSNHLFVSDTPNNRMLSYLSGASTPTGIYGQADFTGYLANRGGAVADNTFSSPLGMAFDPQGNLYLADFENGRVLVFNAPAVAPTPTDTVTDTATATSIAATATETPTPTATPSGLPATPTPTQTPPVAATATPLPTANGSNDAYEPDNSCDQAKAIASDGSSQSHSFYLAADVDWVRFDAIANTKYLVEVEIPPESPADVTLELYTSCAGLPTSGQDYAFSPGVRLSFTATANGPILLKLLNHDATVAGTQVRYDLTVRAETKTPQTGALILVAGGLRPDDAAQPNIYHVTDAVYQMFVNHGYTPDNILYLAPDRSHTNVSALATAAALQSAITTWALNRVDHNRSLTLYLMDHGGKDIFYLDKQHSEWVTPTQLDDWLHQLETVRPGLKVNVIIEACYAGSFITQPQSISRPGRAVLTSTTDNSLAWASANGAYFSDYLLAALDRQENLFTSFRQAGGAAHTFNPGQTAWLDANGDGVVDDAEDGVIAGQRGFAYTGTLADSDAWPPYIAHVDSLVEIANGSGLLRANVFDDVSVQHVWAVIYPPSYVAPSSSEALVQETLPTIKLLDQGKNSYAATFDGFREIGIYRVVLYAEDNQGFTARPVTLEVSTGSRVLLPVIRR